MSLFILGALIKVSVAKKRKVNRKYRKHYSGGNNIVSIVGKLYSLKIDTERR